MEDQQLSKQNLAVVFAEFGMEITPEIERLAKKYESTFNGTHSHTLDSKGRVIIPQQFRDQLGERFCIAPSHDFKSVALYPTAVWILRRERYEKIAQVSSKAMMYLEQFDALSYRDQECDAQGRILLPAKLRKYILEDKKEFEIAGAHNYVRITVAQVAEEKLLDVKANMDSIMAEMDDVSIKLALQSMQL